MKKIKVDISWSGNNYCAGTGAINGVVLVTGKTIDAVKKEFEDAFDFHVKSSIEDGDVLPDFIERNEYMFDYDLQMSAVLHKLDGIITRAALSRATGINQRQLGHYIQGRTEPRLKTQRKIKKGIKDIGKLLTTVV